jgi:hypothetical protein
MTEKSIMTDLRGLPLAVSDPEWVQALDEELEDFERGPGKGRFRRKRLTETISQG